MKFKYTVLADAVAALLTEARLQRAIEKEKAETEALAQRVLAESVDSRVLELRKLEIQKTYADAQLLAAETWDGKQPESVTIFGRRRCEWYSAAPD